MRLLHVDTLELKWFLNPDEPYYVLSHTWVGEEITLQQFEREKTLSPKIQSPGTRKVLEFCEASRGKVEWVWIDTCCIDKTSSAEFQEALNSMWKWYSLAATCVIYMRDVNVHDEATTNIKESDSSPKLGWHQSFEKSRWFLRGWTLQELVAPSSALFVDSKWRPLGMREELGEMLYKITRIKNDYYGNVEKIRSATVAERMSWMRKRETKREEDIAYCMLGIFGVNMTMLYGEGSRAFMRLQEQIINITDDETIFAWRFPPVVRISSPGFLAPSPIYFLSPKVYNLRKHNLFFRAPSRMTNKGIEFEVYANPRIIEAGDEMVIPLNVVYNERETGKEKRLQLTLIALSDGTWCRKDVYNIKAAKVGEITAPESEKYKQSRTLENITRSNGDLAAFWRLEFLNQQKQHKIYIRAACTGLTCLESGEYASFF